MGKIFSFKNEAFSLSLGLVAQSQWASLLQNIAFLNVGINVTNIFNTSYREYLNRLRYFADDLGRNFMLQLKLNY